MTTRSFSDEGLTRLRNEQLHPLVDGGFVPGALVALARRGEVRVEAVGNLAFDGAGAARPMASDTICRLGSTSKPLAAACAMTLVDDGTVGLDDPVDELLPELANMRVLRDPYGPLDDTVPAHRPITLRDLLTFTFGSGMVMAEPGTAPIADALTGLSGLPADERMRLLGSLPLVHQPGERWLYHTAADVTGVLIARATGASFGEALRQRICEPLGMTDTGFSVSDEHLDRFSTAYALDPETGGLIVDDFSHGTFRPHPVFESGGGGIVTTADDLLSFGAMMLAGGTLHGERVLSPEAVQAMTTDHLTPRQKATSGFGPDYFDDMGWGFGLSMRTRRTDGGRSIGSYGWPGYFGTAWYNDPAEDLVAVVLMQRAHAGDQRTPRWTGLWAAVYAALA